MATVSQAASMRAYFEQNYFLPLLEAAIAEGRVPAEWLGTISEAMSLRNAVQVRDRNGRPVSDYAQDTLALVGIALALLPNGEAAPAEEEEE